MRSGRALALMAEYEGLAEEVRIRERIEAEQKARLDAELLEWERAECGCFTPAADVFVPRFTPRAVANLVRLHRRAADDVVLMPWNVGTYLRVLESAGMARGWTPLGWQHALRQAVACQAPAGLVMDALEALE